MATQRDKQFKLDAFDHADRRNIDVISGELLANALTNAVIASAGNKRDIRTATPSSHRLIRAFAAKCNLIVVTGYGFAWSRKRLKIKNVVSINAAKNNEAACVLHIRDVHKMRHRVRVARALLFFILHVHLSMTYLCHHQVM